MRGELEELKLERDRLLLQAGLAAKQNELAGSQAKSEWAEAQARAEAEKIYAEAEKSLNAAQLDKP